MNNSVRNITPADMTSVSRKPERVKAPGEAAVFGDEVKKFSETQEGIIAEAPPQGISIGKSSIQSEHRVRLSAESERSSTEESLVNAYMNNALHTENSEYQDDYGDETLSIQSVQPEHTPAVVNSEAPATVQFDSAASDAVTLNVQEWTSDVIDKAENFRAMSGRAAEHVWQPQAQVSSSDNVGGIEAVKSVENAEAAAGKQIDRGAVLAQAADIAEQSQLMVFETTLDDGSVIRLICKEGPLMSREYARAESKSLSEAPWAVENIAKMLEIMALNGESLEDLEEESWGGTALALLKKYDLWEKSQTEQGQNPVVNSTGNAAVNTVYHTSNSADAGANTNEKQAGHIPQATDPAELNMSGSKIKWTDDNELSVTTEQSQTVERTGAVEQKMAAYSGDQGKIISQQNTAANFTPVDSQAMRAMYKDYTRDNKSESASENLPASKAADTSYSQQNAKPAIIEGVQIPVSYTELSNANAAQPAGIQENLTVEPFDKPAESAVQISSQQTSANAVNVTNSEGSVNLSFSLAETAEEVETGDSQDTLQTGNVQENAAKTIEAAEKALSPLSRVDQQAIIEQISEKLQIAVRNGVHEMRITLRPQELGEVRMNIRVEGDQVTARMLVESEQVKAIVEKHFQQLKDALEQQNLHAAKLSVDVGSDTDRQQMWREMSAASNLKRPNQGGGEDDENGISEQGDNFVTAFGTDTGRRYGNNTFELFV